MKHDTIPLDLEKALASLESAIADSEIARDHEGSDPEPLRKAVSNYRRARTRYNKLLLKYLNT